MLYENYRAKMNKLASVLGVARRFRVLIFCVCAAIVAITATFFAISGIVYDVDKCPVSITVGERLGYSAGAVFNSVRYEFSVSGSDEWSEVQPTRPGEYIVRSVSKSVFGTDRRSAVHAFVIEPKTVEVRVGQSEIVYGEELTVSAELAYSDKIICGNFIYGDYSASETTVTADKNSVTVTDENGNDVSGSYNLKFVTEKIKFLKRDLTVIVENHPEIYNGSPYACSGYEIENEKTALAENDYAVVSTVEFDGSAGEFEITPEVSVFKNFDGTLIDVTGNYNINVISGKLSVEKRPVYVSSGSAQKVYDGTDLTCADFTIDASYPLAEGHSLQVVAAAAQKSAGESNNEIVFKVSDGDGNDVTENYSVLYLEYGKLTVDKRAVAILSADDTQIYDNLAHYCEKYFILEIDGTALFADGETAIVTSNTQCVLAGEYENVLEYKIYNSDGEDVTENYSLILSFGTITISPRPLSIRTYDGLWIYDGEAHSYSGHAEVKSDYGLLEEHHTSASGLATITDVGEVPNLMSIGVYDSQNNNVTLNYKISISTADAGVLRIQPRALTLTAKSAEKIYDGTELVCDEINVENLLEGHTFSGKTVGSQTDCGESDNVVDREAGFTVTADDGTDVSKNYAVTQYIKGTLSVTKRSITVTTASHEFIFNGENNVCEEYSVDGLVEGHTTEASDCAQIRNVTELVENTMTVTVFDGDREVTDNYDISYDCGQLTVKARDVFVETNSNDWVYDGDEHSDDGFKVTEPTEDTGLVKDHALLSENPTKIINAETKPNEMQFTATNGETNNYNVVVTKHGKLTVTKRPVTVTTGTKQQVYDGTVLKCDEVTLSEATEFTGLVKGHEAKAEYWAGVIYVKYDGDKAIGVYNTATIKIYNGSDDVTENYEITKIWGTLTVTKRPVTITTGTKQQVYDGTALKCDEVTPSEATEFTGLVKGHEAKAENGASITEVNSVDNTATIKIYNGNNEVTANYEIEERWGTLTVNPRPVTVTAGSDEKVYDGEELTCSTVEVKEENSQYLLVEGHTVTAETSGSQTIVGSSPNVITDIKTVEILCNGEPVTKNYIIQGLEEGTLTVTKRPITVVADSDEKFYDGDPLTNINISVKTDEEYQLVERHEITGTATGSQTEVGKGENKVDKSSVVITDKDGAPVTDNYEIEYKDGTLEVKPRPITIITGSDKKVYDGTELTCHKLSPDSKPDLVSGHKVDEDKIVYTGTQTDAGESNNTVEESSIIIKDGSVEVTRNYEITVKKGTLKVEQRTVTIVTSDGTWEYDGIEHYNQLHSVRAEDGDLPLVDGHKTKVIAYEKIKDYGTKENAITVEISAADGTPVTQNYDIKYVNGTLTINKRKITVTTATNLDKLIYNGQPQCDDGFEVINLVEGETATAVNAPTVTNVSDGEKENVFSVTIAPRTDNYDIKYVYGSIKINPRPITVAADDDSKVYNGQPQAGNKAKVTDGSLVSGHTIAGVTTESSSANCGEYTVKIIDNSAKITGGDIENYLISYDTESSATLTITPRPLTVTAGSAEKEYDGLPLTCDSVQADNLINGHYITAILDGSQTEPGKSASVIRQGSVTISDGTYDVTENYEITLEEGTLTVTEASTAEPILILKILSEVGGDIYLKNISYGDYTGTTQWSAAPEYSGRLEYGGKEYSLDYLFSLALMNAGYKTDNVKISTEYGWYYLPYYTALGEYGYTIQTSDVYYEGTSREYSLAHYFYNYISEGLPAPFDGYGDIEKAYRDFVYKNYLKVRINNDDTQTEAFLDKIIAEQGFDGNDPDIVGKVADFVQNSAEYNMEYNPAVDSENTLISFFEYKEGVCRHYATAATLIFRRLNIPARYTGGLHTAAAAGEWTEVYNTSGHAWVEVYRDGYGWVQVEVTGSMPAEGGNGEDINSEIVLKPARAVKYYDGTPLYATKIEDNMFVSELTAKGYELTVHFGGSLTEVGKGVSVITSYTLKNKDGVNVTSQYEFKVEEGELEVVDPDKNLIVYFNTYENSVTYNGDEHTVSGSYCSDTESGFRLPDGVTYSVSGLENVKLTEAGVITESEFVEKYLSCGLVKIAVSRNGVDITENCVFVYNINLSVARRSITVKTNSVTKEYDGKPLKNDTCTVSGEGLAAGHKLVVQNSSSITDIGDTQNIVLFTIKDADGKDVTDNYVIERIYGVLTVISD